LVLGSNYRGLGVVRSLGRLGVTVWLVRSDAHRIAERSRYAARVLPWCNGSDEAKIAHLLGLAAHHGLERWTLIPTDDETASLLARNHDTLGKRFMVAAPSWETMRFAYDKRLTYQLGGRAGVAQPRTWFPVDRADVLAADCPLPAILKPAVKPEQNRFTHDKAWLVRDRMQLQEAYDAARALVPAEEIMLQELIPFSAGAQLSVGALAVNGRPVATVTAREVRQHPRDFGHASTFVETIECFDIVEAARRLIAELGYTGLIEVEFKRDPRDGQPKLLDINARVWGWHTLGKRAGVDFAALQWRLLHGESVPQVHAHPSVRWVRMATDLPTAAREIIAGRMALGAYLWSLRPPLEHAMFASDDPLPGLLDAPLIVALAAQRAVRGQLRQRRR
jgi:predicted ATP-grasp superfamily ATP-dependent carboligase